MSLELAREISSEFNLKLREIDQLVVYTSILLNEIPTIAPNLSATDNVYLIFRTLLDKKTVRKKGQIEKNEVILLNSMVEELENKIKESAVPDQLRELVLLKIVIGLLPQAFNFSPNSSAAD